MASYARLPAGALYTPRITAFCCRCGVDLKGIESVVNLLGFTSQWKRLTCKTCVRPGDKAEWIKWNHGQYGQDFPAGSDYLEGLV